MEQKNVGQDRAVAASDGVRGHHGDRGESDWLVSELADISLAPHPAHCQSESRHHKGPCDCGHDYNRTIIGRAVAALSVAARDGARYRWLRGPGFHFVRFQAGAQTLSTDTSDVGMDAAIDAAINDGAAENAAPSQRTTAPAPNATEAQTETQDAELARRVVELEGQNRKLRGALELMTARFKSANIDFFGENAAPFDLRQYEIARAALQENKP